MKRILYSAMVIAIMMGCGRTQSTETDFVKPIAVTTIKVVPADGAYDLRYSGTIEALQTIPLTFQVTGTVDKIYVEVGDAVKKGQLLASVDNSDMLNIHNVSLAKYQQAKDAYTRLKAVHEQGSLTEIKWVEMESNMEQAKSSLDMAKNNLEKCSIGTSSNTAAIEVRQIPDQHFESRELRIGRSPAVCICKCINFVTESIIHRTRYANINRPCGQQSIRLNNQCNIIAIIIADGLHTFGIGCRFRKQIRVWKSTNCISDSHRRNNQWNRAGVHRPNVAGGIRPPSGTHECDTISIDRKATIAGTNKKLLGSA